MMEMVKGWEISIIGSLYNIQWDDQMQESLYMYQ